MFTSYIFKFRVSPLLDKLILGFCNSTDRILKSMLGTVKLLTVVAFAYLTVNSAMAKPLSVLFLPIFLSLMFGSLIFFIVKLVTAK